MAASALECGRTSASFTASNAAFETMEIEMASETITRTFLSYKDFETSMAILTDKVRTAQKTEKWTAVIGVAMGGLPAATHIAKHLDLPLLICTPAKVPGVGERIRFSTPDFEAFQASKPLFVDDFYDTGKTTRLILDCSHGCGKPLSPANFAYAFVRKQKKTKFMPRFYGEHVVQEDGWLHFPWEPMP